MISDKRVLAVVPARGGSKGIPLKNLRKLMDIPLVAHVGDVIRRVKYIDRAIVSTDHPDIATVAESVGIAAPFMRPESLSGDHINSVEVITHALNEIEKHDNILYDIVVVLEPTSPLRVPSEVDAAIERLIADVLDSVWTLSETDSKSHPLKQLVINEGKLSYYANEGPSIVARQQLSTVYHRNGVAYAVTRECLLEQKTLMGKRAGAVVLDAIHISIDTEFDLEFAEYVLAKREIRNSREQGAATSRGP